MDTKYNTKRFLGMEDLTLVPIQKKLVDVELLTDAELDSLNAYHQRVLKEVPPVPCHLHKAHIPQPLLAESLRSMFSALQAKGSCPTF